MTQKGKGYIGLGVMVVLAAATVLGSTPLYQAIDSLAAKSNKSIYKPGSYTGSAVGYGGEIMAIVGISERGIVSVELQGDDETPELGGEALNRLENRFLEAGSAQVDGITGCTMTSNGAIAAMQQALDQAK